ncbi:MAG: hypothetical protein KAI83_03045 [Thiomargarita sp.]|nr:hypothetical protein [Thiomargarita sp.]
MNHRQQLLQALLTFSKPLNLIAQELGELEWDYEGETVLVEPLHIVSILNRFLSNQLNAKQVEEWANMIECREDLDYESDNQKQLEQVIYEIANPELEGILTIERCQDIFILFSLSSTSQHDYVQQSGVLLERILGKYKTTMVQTYRIKHS